MKTKFYLLTLLAFAAQVVVNAQTNNQSSHRILGTLGNKSETSNAPAKNETAVTTDQKVIENKTSTASQKVESNNTQAISEKDKKNYPTLISSEPNNKSQLASTDKKEAKKTDNNTYNYYANENCYNTMVYAAELIKQAEELASIEQVLRTSAKTKVGEEKNKLIKSANELRAQAELKQIQASEIAGKLNLEKFNNNKVIFVVLIKKVSANESVVEEAKIINTEAEYSMKLAKEMREEAYAMHNNAAKLGTMSNAEEKETEALNKQDEAINKIKKYTAGTGGAKKTNDLAAN